MATRDLVADLKPHHVAISVSNLDRSIGFWQDNFGFVVEQETNIPTIKVRLAFLVLGDFRLELFELDGSVPVPAHRRLPNTDLAEQGCKHVGFQVQNVQKATEALYARGIPILGLIRKVGEPMEQVDDPALMAGQTPAIAVFFHDPDGTLVELLEG